MRKITKQINVGAVKIGGGADIVVQSMCNTFTDDIKATVKQIKNLEEAGCQIARIAIPDLDAANAIAEIKKQTKIPLIADIHFDYRLAIESIKNGIDGLRLNPGNIGSIENIKKVVEQAKPRQIPIRIGVNSGSLKKELVEKKGVCAESIVESALEHIKILEDLNYTNIKVSVKASSVPLTIESYKLISQKCDYPLHLGVTEAGCEYEGIIKSSVGIGTLLALGIGDTIRVSLTADPVKEVKAAYTILKSLNLVKGLDIISCPTCGRTQIDLISLANKAHEKLAKFANKELTVAVMGCVVNGPGEAKEADYGIAGGKNEGLIFKKGKILKKVSEDKLLDELCLIIEKDLQG